MAKIGILILTNKEKERTCKKTENHFHSKFFKGFKYIISEIDKSNTVEDCTFYTMNDYDFVLCSVTSYYDVLTLIKNIREDRKCRIIIGGQGVININIASHISDIAVLGRAEGQINGILEGKEYDNVWRKNIDPNIEKIYKFRKPERLLELEEIKETHVGCPNKCFYCEYSWVNDFFPKNKANYKNDYANVESTMNYFEWNFFPEGKYVPRLKTAIDGMSEKIRHVVNKNISNEMIIDKMSKFYVQERKTGAVQIYCIIGYPFEEKLNTEFIDIIKSIDKTSEKKCNIFITSVHFCPMPFTPMENEPINFIDFSKSIRTGNMNMKGKTMNIYWNASSPTIPYEEIPILRAQKDDIPKLKQILLSSKWKTARTDMKGRILKKYFPERLWGYCPDPVEHIEKPKGLEAAKKVYYKRKQEYSESINV